MTNAYVQTMTREEYEHATADLIEELYETEPDLSGPEALARAIAMLGPCLAAEAA